MSGGGRYIYRYINPSQYSLRSDDFSPEGFVTELDEQLCKCDNHRRLVLNASCQSISPVTVIANSAQ